MEEKPVTIMVRLGAEVTIKSPRTRTAFLRRLRRNMSDALNAAGVEYRIEAMWGRIFVRASSQLALPAVARVFGISSVSPVEHELDADLDAIVAEGAAHFQAAV